MVYSWTFEDFKAAISEDVGSSSISDINLKVLLLHGNTCFQQQKRKGLGVKEKKEALTSGRFFMELNETLQEHFIWLESLYFII